MSHVDSRPITREQKRALGNKWVEPPHLMVRSIQYPGLVQWYAYLYWYPNKIALLLVDILVKMLLQYVGAGSCSCWGVFTSS